MKETHAAWFVSPRNVDEILTALRSAEDVTWAMRESEHFGRYIKGKTSSDISVTIQANDEDRYLVEVFFPTREGRRLLADQAKQAFLTRLAALLGAAGLRETQEPTR